MQRRHPLLARPAGRGAKAVLASAAPAPRSRRLRWRPHADAALGFEVAVVLQPIVDGAGATSFWHAFVTEAIEALSLTYGGGEHGFVARAGVGSATEADREMVAAWLHARPDVASFVVGPLVDAEPLHGKR